MTIQEDATVLLRPAGKSKASLARQEAQWGFLFLSPWIFGLIVFTSIPMLASLALSFTNFRLATSAPMEFVGLDQYVKVFQDPLTFKSLRVTITFALMSLPLTIGAALGLAILLNNKLLAGKRFFRTFFFMPVQVPLVASTMIWIGFLNPVTGWMDGFIRFITGGTVSGPEWFQNPGWALPALTAMGLWGVGNMMLIFLAGLQGVPTELYEAAKVDGAGAWRQFRNITLPMITPVLFYNLLISTIGVAQYFTPAYILDGTGNGGVDGAAYFFNLDLYKNGWTYNAMGYASAMAWVMFIAVVVIAFLMFRTSARWVFYAGGDR